MEFEVLRYFNNRTANKYFICSDELTSTPCFLLLELMKADQHYTIRPTFFEIIHCNFKLLEASQMRKDIVGIMRSLTVPRPALRIEILFSIVDDIIDVERSVLSAE